MHRKMKEDRQKVLAAQTAKIEDIIETLRQQFGEEFDDEINFLEIVKGNLSK